MLKSQYTSYQKRIFCNILRFSLLLHVVVSVEFVSFPSFIADSITDQCDTFTVDSRIAPHFFNLSVATSNKLCSFFCLRHLNCHGFYVTPEQPCVFCSSNADADEHSNVTILPLNLTQAVSVKGSV